MLFRNQIAVSYSSVIVQFNCMRKVFS